MFQGELPGNPQPTIVDHLRLLDLAPDASGDQVRAAFRRLARLHHPDLDRTPFGHRRFIEIVAAYRVLQIEMGLRPDMAHYRLCPRCGHYAELLDGLDGVTGCPECLLGMTERRRYLPMPIFVTVKHLATVLAYALSVLLAYLYVQGGPPLLAALSLVSAACGLLAVWITCFRVPEVCPAYGARRRAGGRR